MKKIILSGMRPTGNLHLGHLNGVLKNWLILQEKYNCFFFVADWHALTTNYNDTKKINLEKNAIDIVIDWLACGIDANKNTIFIQSKVPEHSELNILLSMITPLSWLERIPSYKDQKLNLSDKNINTYGFLGYPLLQSSDILIYNADYVPVGQDQLAHIELTRKIARRFNYLYGQPLKYNDNFQKSFNKLTKKEEFIKIKKKYQRNYDMSYFNSAKKIIDKYNLSKKEKKLLIDFLDGNNEKIFKLPYSLVNKNASFVGLDGRKMSKSYNNTISLRENYEDLLIKINKITTDPKRIRKQDPGNPNDCNIWPLHKIYSDKNILDNIFNDCTQAKIGCVDCKKNLHKSIIVFLDPIQENIKKLENNMDYIQDIIISGNNKARIEARKTLDKVQKAMNINI